MICKNPKCRKEFFEDWRKKIEGPCEYCCYACSHTREHSQKTRKKISIAISLQYKNHTRKPPVNPWTQENRERQGKRLVHRYLQANLLHLKNGEYEKMSRAFRRKQVLSEANFTCGKCNNRLWLSEPIPLEVHHKDGNRKNNKRDNLEALCLNCHYFTDKYRFKGRRHDGH